MRSTTTRPVRATTVADTWARTVTWALTGAATTERPGTWNPWNATGTRRPSSVTKVMSTVASSGKGLNNTRTSRASRVVAPAAKCQRSDAEVAHGPASTPSGPLTSCSTATWPAPNSTRAAA